MEQKPPYRTYESKGVIAAPSRAGGIGCSKQDQPKVKADSRARHSSEETHMVAVAHRGLVLFQHETLQGRVLCPEQWTFV